MVTGVVMMKIATVKEFRDKATVMLRSTEPVLIMRRGRVAGFFLPAEGESLPLELRRDLQMAIAEVVRKNLQARGFSEESILRDFEKFRSARRRR